MEYDDIILETDNIFEESQSLIFKDEYPFTIEYLPSRLIGRKIQVEQVSDLVNPLFRNGKPSSALIYGKTGSGKSVVVKFVLTALVKKLIEKDFQYKFQWINVPCKQILTTSGILYYILIQINPLINLSKKGHSLSTYYSFLWEEITKNDLNLIIVLDEIDRLKDDEIIYNLSRAGENRNIPERRYISIIGISNNLHYKDNIDPRVISSAGFHEIIFNPYDAEQIYSILKDRAELALYPDVIDNDTLFNCASRASKADGDARKAIETLKTAAKIVDKNKEEKITKNHIIQANEELAENKYLKLAETLPLHNKLVLLCVLKLNRLPNGKRTTNIVTETYIDMCKFPENENDKIIPLARTTISGIISELEMLGFFKLNTLYRGRAGGVTRQIQFADKVPIDLLSDILYEDYGIDGLQDFLPSVYKYE